MQVANCAGQLRSGRKTLLVPQSSCSVCPYIPKVSDCCETDPSCTACFLFISSHSPHELNLHANDLFLPPYWRADAFLLNPIHRTQIEYIIVRVAAHRTSVCFLLFVCLSCYGNTPDLAHVKFRVYCFFII